MESIINFFQLALKDIPIYGLMIITSGSLLIFKKNMSMYSMIFIFLVVNSILFSFINNIYVFSFIVLILLIGNITFKIRNEDIDFRKIVLTLSIFPNLVLSNFCDDNHKKLGHIIPYNKSQLRYNKKMLEFSYKSSRGGTLISGSTGSGKTYGMKSLIYQDLDKGHPVALFEYKGDHKLVKEISEYATNKDIEVYKMSLQSNNFNYDPLSDLNQTARVEALLNTRKWSMDGGDEHYRFSTQLLIQKLVIDFDKIWDKKSNYTSNFYDFICKYNYEKSSHDAYLTILKMLEILLTSHLGPMWRGEYDKTFKFSNEKQYLVIFSFVSSNKSLANSVSSFAFRDLLEAGTLNPFVKELCLYVDEFGTLENSYVIKDILEKGRSCGIATTISLQDINQIVINTNQAYLNSILGTVNTFIIYSGATKTTAEILSGVQIYDIDKILLTLKKPDEDRKTTPTALFISKYPYIEKYKSVDVFKIAPYIHTKSINKSHIETEEKSVEKIKLNNLQIKEKEQNITEEEIIEEIVGREEEKERVDYNSFI